MTQIQRTLDEEASSEMFFTAVESWLSLLDGIGLLDVEVEHVSVLGEDGESKRRGRIRVLILVVLSKGGRCRVVTCCGGVLPGSLMQLACRHPDVILTTDGAGGFIDNGGTLADTRSWARFALAGGGSGVWCFCQVPQRCATFVGESSGNVVFCQ